MKKQNAIAKAQRKALKYNQSYYVVYDPAYEENANENSFHVCMEEELDGFFTGADVVYSTEDAQIHANERHNQSLYDSACGYD